MKQRRIGVVTTSRADFGLLRGLLTAIRQDPLLRLQLIASGMHLSRRFGLTVREIESEGFEIDRKIVMPLTGDSELSNLKAIARGTTGFANALSDLKPEILVMLGDRFELLAPAVSSLMLRIPIAHIHGGERSEGAIDESIRHAITKMASIHFPATESYRKRIIQMGESPTRVFNFGAPGLDQLYRAPLMDRAQLKQEIGFDFNNPVAIVTYHPATLDHNDVEGPIRQLVAAIKASKIRAIFTAANADAHGAQINAYMSALCAKFPERFRWFDHLGHYRYLSCLKHCAVMIGNSSSGLTEAPSFRLPVVNIGDRQRGRVRAANIIDVPNSRAAILRGIEKACTPKFRATLRNMRNPYERFRDGRTSERIKDVLKRVPLTDDLLKKTFHDLL